MGLRESLSTSACNQFVLPELLLELRDLVVRLELLLLLKRIDLPPRRLGQECALADLELLLSRESVDGCVWRCL